MEIPARYSPKWWFWLTTAATVIGVSTMVILYVSGIVTDPVPLIVIALAVSVLGDLVMAVALETLAPTRIMLGPGERQRHADAMSAVAEVVSGFDNSPVGKVRVRGELWSARSGTGSPLGLARGQQVKVLGRDGLSLLVCVAEDTAGPRRANVRLENSAQQTG